MWHFSVSKNSLSVHWRDKLDFISGCGIDDYPGLLLVWEGCSVVHLNPL